MNHTRRNFFRQAGALGAAAGLRSAGAAQDAPAKLDIFQAAAAGDIPRVTELANIDPQLVRSHSEDGRTPLHYAAAAGKPAMVMFLVSRGAIIDAGPEAPLLAAVDLADATAAYDSSQPLLANAADPNARRRDGKTALDLARARGHHDLVELLIHRGAKADEAEAAGIERVHFGRRYIRDIHGKPVEREDLNGLAWTAVNRFVSLAHADFETVKRLYQETPALLNTRASWDELPVEAAAHMGRADMAAWLAERGAVISTCTAVLLGEEKLVADDLAADPLAAHECGAHDIAILAFTAYAGEHTAIAERLLKAVANANGRALKQTPLHLAASKGYADLVELLIGHGADLKAKAPMKEGMGTPLAAAVRAGQSKVERLLRDRGAEL